MSNYNQNGYGYLSSKIKQIEHKVISIKAENTVYLEEIETRLSAIKQNNEILNVLSRNLTAVGEMAQNMEENLIIVPNPERRKVFNKIA